MALAWLVLPAILAQAGDVEGEAQPPLPANLDVPPAPARSPEEERATFRLPPGLAIELVAAEPLVRDPVCARFDDRGRLWVVEMQSYMPDVDGTGEDAPTGSVAVLTDADGDGRMDERATFLDGLVLPRAVAPTGDGALVIAPPDLFFAPDRDGDLRADGSETILTGLGGLASPEHAVNGLVLGLDGWYECANEALALRRTDAGWETRAGGGGGQWGLSRDDQGRWFFNNNSQALRHDPFPAHYALRNPSLGRAAGTDLPCTDSVAVWPARMTPGVNRGYREGLLDSSWRLTRLTGACGPHVYRGDALGPAFAGDAFVCEPCGNLVKRLVLSEDELGRVRAEDAYAGRDFLTSTDERFRPVHLLDGPDGALYVVDMYRGLIQHRLFVTSWLRAQVEARGLEEPTGLGRIWRVRPAEGLERERPDLAGASWEQLGAWLGHPNGWLRDAAQQTFVTEGPGDAGAIDIAAGVLREAEDGRARLHALWALAGMRALSPELARSALADPDPRVALQAVRASEPWLGAPESGVLEATLAAARRAGPRVRHQALLSLGECARGDCEVALLALLAEDATTEELRTAAVSGLAGRELRFLERLLAADTWRALGPGRDPFLRLLARCIAREGRGTALARVLELAAGDPLPWRRRALALGLEAGRPPGPDGRPGYLELPHAPPPEVQDALPEPLVASLAWPGKPGLERPTVRPLSDVERERFELGRTLYSMACAGCHGAAGQGRAGLAPTLRHTEWVLGPPERLIDVVTRGLSEPIEVHGERWHGDMPPFAAPPEDVAAVLTFVRRSWGHGADPVTAGDVARRGERAPVDAAR